MPRRILLFIFMLCLFFGLDGCNEEKDVLPEERVGFAYFPLTIGDSRVYEVEKITSTPVVDSLKENSFLKEEVVDSFSNDENDSVYVIHRFSKIRQNDPWQLDSAWTARRTANHAIVVENNVPFIKLSFPVAKSLTWNGNAFNTRNEDDYEIVKVGEVYQGLNESFNNTVSVLQEDGSDQVVFFDLREEVYALNLGLVYKEISQIIYCNDSESGCLGQGIIENSFSLKLKLIEHDVQ